jgi:asparagine N-glycosylation enzyme membrane subunit Stt3
MLSNDLHINIFCNCLNISIDIESYIFFKEQAIANRIAFYYHLRLIISFSFPHSVFLSFSLSLSLSFSLSLSLSYFFFHKDRDYILLVIISQLLSLLSRIDRTEHSQVDRSV